MVRGGRFDAAFAKLLGPLVGKAIDWFWYVQFAYFVGMYRNLAPGEIRLKSGSGQNFGWISGFCRIYEKVICS